MHIVPHKVQFSKRGEPIPFVRSPFPALIRDRSPILGLTNRVVLRTCFRMGEALNAASLASRQGTDAIIELYARAVDSSRQGFKQFFTFADLFTENPPYLKGVYGKSACVIVSLLCFSTRRTRLFLSMNRNAFRFDGRSRRLGGFHTALIRRNTNPLSLAGMWKGVDLWEQDSRVFLGEDAEGKMCRVLGRIKKERGKSPEITVLSIWECGWADVGISKGIMST